MDSKVLPCDCKSTYQDKLYGQGQRLHSCSGKTPGQSRCTVCGKVKK